MKNIILCADDYGFSPNISKAIITLIANNRLNATSCMVNSSHWKEHAEWLRVYKDKIDIGLHFALTDITPATMTLQHHPDIIKKAYFRKLKQSEIENELESQITKFKDAMGQLPNFIDGHQHIHQLPIIRNALLKVYEKHFPNQNCYIRIPISSPTSFKSLVIKHTGASKLKKHLKQRDIPYNKSFSGVYNFSNKDHYEKHFRRFLQHIDTDGIIMCHPGLSDSNAKDSIAAERQQEFLYLNSKRFLEDCNHYSIRLASRKSNLCS